MNRTKRILLIESGYKVKYPPLGLMKISTFHKQRGDEVIFYKGKSAAIRDQDWDTIYITTLFTFQWKVTIDTINFYQRGKQRGKKNVVVGGIMATLLSSDLEFETGIRPHTGLWPDIDRLHPDYNLTNGTYTYYTDNASIGYMSKGCPNHCPYCAVPELEPDFIKFIPLRNQIDQNKRDLLLLDNNVLASASFPQIVDEIIECGFYKGAMFNKSHRFVDFNQGVDARLLTEDKLHLLSKLALRPLRIAFDNISLKKLYAEKIRLAHKYGFKHLSNYILYNFHDTPSDFYNRLKLNIDLNEELDLSIFSFPMKYIPLNAKDRKYVSSEWTWMQLRGVQRILHATHGVVGPKRSFYEAAFGKSVEEFLYIIGRPEDEIFYRDRMKPFITK
jgi:hypothetical protein